MLEQHAEIRCRAGNIVNEHHAVVRLHRPWHHQQRPDLFADAYAAAKHKLDPHGIMSFGIIVDP